MIKHFVDKFKEQGLEVIYAHCDGFTNSVKIQGVEPDVVAWDPNKEIYHLGIVTDSKTISSDPVQEKMNVLSNMMMGVGSSEGERLPFHIGLPKKQNSDILKNMDDTFKTSQNNINVIEV